MKMPIVAAGTIAVAMLGIQSSTHARGLGIDVGVIGTSQYSHIGVRYDAQEDALPRWRVLKRLERRGYHGFQRLQLKGHIYKVRARRHGHVFKIWVDAYSGEILKRRRIA